MDANFIKAIHSTNTAEFETARDYLTGMMDRADTLTASNGLRPVDVILAAYTLFWSYCEEACYDYIAVEEYMAEILRNRKPRGYADRGGAPKLLGGPDKVAA